MSKITFRSDSTILVKDVRLSYPHLFEPWAGEEGATPRFSGSFIMSNKTHAAEIKALKEHVVKLSQEKFKAKLPLDRYFLRNGDDRMKDEYADSWYISASEKSTKPPLLLNKDRSVIRTDNGIIYAGCYVDVLIKPWMQDNTKGGKRCNANLLAVQFRRDGEAFADATRPDPTEVFEDLSDSDFDDDSGSDDPFAD